MLDAAREAVSFAEKKVRTDLDDNRQLTLALLKSVEIIGEAASQISRKYQQEHADIPWAAIVGMRNRLIHGYFDIDLDRVWDTVVHDLPPLIMALEKLVLP